MDDDIKIIENPGSFPIIVTPGTPEDKILLVEKGGSVLLQYGKPEFIGNMPIRSDITTLPADDPKQKITGWTVIEQIGVSVINPGSMSRLIIENHEVLCWPLPGRPDFKLRAVYMNSRQARRAHLLVSLDKEKASSRTIGNWDEDGWDDVFLAGGDSQLGSQITWDAGAMLCTRVCNKSILNTPGPNLQTLIADQFWNKFIEELPNALTVASVMFS